MVLRDRWQQRQCWQVTPPSGRGRQGEVHFLLRVAKRHNQPAFSNYQATQPFPEGPSCSEGTKLRAILSIPGPLFLCSEFAKAVQQSLL
jgi:hypothetical protein